MAEIILPPEENEETPQMPELDIDKPTENSKVITIEFEAKKTNKVSTKDTNQQLYTTDTDAWFEFKETSLEGANGTYSVVFRNRHDGSIFQRTGDVVNGVAYYKIPEQEIRHAGKWRGQLVYTLENGDTTAREFGYEVKGHILDGKDVREIVVEDFETLISQLNSMKDNAELELADLVNAAERNELERQQFYESLVEDINDLQDNYQELLDTGVLQTNINTKLEALEEEYAPKLTEVTAQLAHKAGRSEVRLKRDSIGLNDVSSEVLSAIEGGEGTSFNLESIPRDHSVSPIKTDFLEQSNNIFNVNGVELNKSVDTSGNIIDESGRALSDFIEVERGETLHFTEDISARLVAYDAEKTFAGRATKATGSTSYTVPSNGVYFIKISPPMSQMDRLMVNRGDELLPFEPYYLKFKRNSEYVYDVDTDSIEDKAVTTEKRTINGVSSVLHVEGGTAVPNINLNNKTLTLYSGTRLSYGKTLKRLDANQVLSFESSYMQNILYDTETGNFSSRDTSSVIGEDELLIGTIVFTSSAQDDVQSVWLTCSYTVNGVSPSRPDDAPKIVLAGSKTPIHIDSIAGKMIISKPFYLVHQNRSIGFTSGENIVLDIPSGITTVYLYFDEEDNNFSLMSRSDITSTSARQIQLGYFSTKDGVEFDYVDFSAPVTTNPPMKGQETNGGEVSSRPYLFTPEELTGYYEPSANLDFSVLHTSRNINSVQDMYDLYEVLIDENPDYFTKRLLGMDESGGYPIFEYTLKPDKLDIPNFDKEFPKILLWTGMHGAEKNSQFSMYHFIYDICKNWQSNPILEYFRWNVEIKFIPCGNPWAFDNGEGRKNFNGVDVNRNFNPYFRYEPDPDAPTYAGEEPLTEVEAQYGKQFIDENTDALFFIDYHNHFSQTDWWLWHAHIRDETDDTALRNASRYVINKSIVRILGKHGDLFDGERPGHINETLPNGRGRGYASSLGIPSMLIECFPTMSEWGIEKSIEASTEYTGNFLWSVLKSFKDYN